MKKPVEIPNWAVVYFRGRMQLDPRKVATEMKAVCSQKGMVSTSSWGLFSHSHIPPLAGCIRVLGNVKL